MAGRGLRGAGRLERAGCGRVAFLRVRSRVERLERPSEGHGIFQCIATPAVVAGATYTYGGRVRIPSGQARTGPSMLKLHGAGGTFFHSDLLVMNLSFSETAGVTAQYQCFTGQTCNTAPCTLTLGPRASALYSDAVGTLFASPDTAGAIELAFDPSVGDIAATSRVYTPSLPAPTYGASVPGQLSNRALTHALFLGLGSSEGDASRGFRTNAGAYNPNSAAVSVTFELHRADGYPLGAPLTRTWEAFEAFQISGLFGAVGAGGAVTTNAWLAVTASAPVFPFVTVIDNQSGDSTWVVPWEDAASAP